MGNVTIIDSAGDGRLHMVTVEGRCAVYLRDTDVRAESPVMPPDWIADAGKVASWADGKGGKRASGVRAAIDGAGLYRESRPMGHGVYGLAVYPGNQAARRVTLAALSQLGLA